MRRLRKGGGHAGDLPAGYRRGESLHELRDGEGKVRGVRRRGEEAHLLPFPGEGPLPERPYEGGRKIQATHREELRRGEEPPRGDTEARDDRAAGGLHAPSVKKGQE